MRFLDFLGVGGFCSILGDDTTLDFWESGIHEALTLINEIFWEFCSFLYNLNSELFSGYPKLVWKIKLARDLLTCQKLLGGTSDLAQVGAQSCDKYPGRHTCCAGRLL